MPRQTVITNNNNTKLADVKDVTPISTDVGLLVREIEKISQVSVINVPSVSIIAQPISVDVVNSIPISISSITFPTVQNVSVVNSCISICPGAGGIPVATNTSDALTTAPQYKVYEHNFALGENALVWYSSTATGGTVTFPGTDASCTMNITATSGSQVIRQSRRVLAYQGDAMFGSVGALIGSIKANTRQRIGMFDASDGLFFEQNGSVFRAVYRTSASGGVVDTAIAQAAFNVDKFDGTGPSGLTLNTANFNLYGFRWFWLGGVYELGLFVDGYFYVGHRFSVNNTITLPPSAMPNLPFRLELTATAAVGSTTSMKYYGVYAYSRTDKGFGIARSVSTSLSVAAAAAPVISIRLKSAASKAIAILKSLALISTNATNNVFFQLVYNPATLTGASWVDVPGNNTITQYDISASSYTGGDVVYSNYTAYYGNAQDIIHTRGGELVFLSSNIAGTSDIFTLVANRVSGPTYTVYPVLNFEEYF